MPATELVVFSDDWGRHPSSCQHLVARLPPELPVCWVNTIGTRYPSLDLYTLRRGAGKLWRWLASSKAGSGREHCNPRVIDPVMWPGFHTPFQRRINRRLLTRAVRRALEETPSRIAVTTIPLVADLVGTLPVDRWVYYCVDDLSHWPGLDQQALETMERDLVERVDEVIAVSHELVERMRAFGREARLLTHGVDLDHWRRRKTASLPEVEALPEPRVVFWGLVDRRLDIAWLGRLGEGLERGTVVIAGPSEDPDPALNSLRRVVRIGPLPYDELPALAELAAVLVMPYADMASTRASQPLKLKEYLATARPVVTSRLPAVEEWRDACDVVGSAEEFLDTVTARLATGLPAAQRAARRRLEEESWEAKASTFARIVLGDADA